MEKNNELKLLMSKHNLSYDDIVQLSQRKYCTVCRWLLNTKNQSEAKPKYMQRIYDNLPAFIEQRKEQRNAIITQTLEIPTFPNPSKIFKK